MNKEELEEHIKSLERFETELKEFKYALRIVDINPIKEAGIQCNIDWSGDLESQIGFLKKRLEIYLITMSD